MTLFKCLATIRSYQHVLEYCIDPKAGAIPLRLDGMDIDLLSFSVIESLVDTAKLDYAKQIVKKMRTNENHK